MEARDSGCKSIGEPLECGIGLTGETGNGSGVLSGCFILSTNLG